MASMVIERDFRKLTPATQAELRRVAVAMVRAGKTRIEAAETVGVNRRFVGQWHLVARIGRFAGWICCIGGKGRAARRLRPVLLRWAGQHAQVGAVLPSPPLRDTVHDRCRPSVSGLPLPG